MYIVDNSGSMGECESYDKNAKNYSKIRSKEAEYPINKLKETLSIKFQKENLAKNNLKEGLIEVGGKANKEGECRAEILVYPQLKN